jgi:pimeloyl-ACP methyl ester carboxylesterase
VTEKAFEVLRDTVGVCLVPGAVPEALCRALGAHSLDLPECHRKLLCLANGMTVYHGYFRLFGVGASEGTDVLAWNSPDTWKFAWSPALLTFLCFAETGWGDQYAYALAELGQPVPPRVYFLEGITMEPEVVADSFEEFFMREFLPCASAPYDSVIPTVYERMGDLAWDLHITYMPSLLLGGEEHPERVMTMNARAHMIVSGDIAMQCAHESAHRRVQGLEEYVDAKGRVRVRVVWS